MEGYKFNYTVEEIEDAIENSIENSKKIDELNNNLSELEELTIGLDKTNGQDPSNGSFRIGAPKGNIGDHSFATAWQYSLKFVNQQEDCKVFTIESVPQEFVGQPLLKTSCIYDTNSSKYTYITGIVTSRTTVTIEQQLSLPSNCNVSLYISVANIASGDYSHAEGYNTEASKHSSHAEGCDTTASSEYSHAEGYNTIARGNSSHAEGWSTMATNYASHAEGYSTTASNYASHSEGHYNANMTTGGSSSNTTGTAFAIGNGTNTSTRSNAFSVQFSGVVKAKSTITASTTADYAEFFEWLDENPDGEDRVGHFVTLDGDKIRIATDKDDYILGVVSGEPFVLGNGDCDTWNGMYLHDEFRRTMYEPAPKVIEVLDEEGRPTGEWEEVEGEFEGTRPILNPNYDYTKPYISRFDRKEWSPIGMLGVLAVRHDGTAKVNGYVTVNKDGIATACSKGIENSYRVIKNNSDKVVEIIFR